MKEFATYDNDTDLRELLYTDVTDEKVLRFIFKKGGKVNATNLQYCISLQSKKNISDILLNLETSGLIKAVDSHHYKVTGKAYWRRFRDSKTVQWTIAIIGLIATFLALR